MNWIIPNRVMALSSPNSSAKSDAAKPEKVLAQFKQLKIKHVIRLNDSLYDESVFTQAGIQVHDLEFPDGTCPDFVSFE